MCLGSMWLWIWACHGIHVEVRGQILRVGSAFHFRSVSLVPALCDRQASWSVSSWVILPSHCFKSVGITDVCSCVQLVMWVLEMELKWSGVCCKPLYPWAISRDCRDTFCVRLRAECPLRAALVTLSGTSSGAFCGVLFSSGYMLTASD